MNGSRMTRMTMYLKYNCEGRTFMSLALQGGHSVCCWRKHWEHYSLAFTVFILVWFAFALGRNSYSQRGLMILFILYTNPLRSSGPHYRFLGPESECGLALHRKEIYFCGVLGQNCVPTLCWEHFSSHPPVSCAASNSKHAVCHLRVNFRDVYMSVGLI